MLRSLQYAWMVRKRDPLHLLIIVHDQVRLCCLFRGKKPDLLQPLWRPSARLDFQRCLSGPHSLLIYHLARSLLQLNRMQMQSYNDQIQQVSSLCFGYRNVVHLDQLLQQLLLYKDLLQCLLETLDGL